MTPEQRQVVATVLRDIRLHPVLDEQGVSAPETEETRAREALLTDRRLKKTDEGGFEVPAIAPAEPAQIQEDR